MTSNQKHWYQSRTIWYAVLTGVAGIIAAISTQYPDIGIFTTLNSVITIMLRVTTEKQISTPEN